MASPRVYIACMSTSMNTNRSKQSLILAGGCFWGLEHLLADLKGVTATEVGYTGGNLDNPTYEDVKTGNTGHAEAVRLEYDPAQIPLAEILHFFFRIHDPTTVNHQGNDIGTQYRSIVFYASEQEKAIVEKVIDEVNQLGRFSDKVVTEVLPVTKFYTAEDYHQKYLVRHPNGYTCHFIRK